MCLDEQVDSRKALQDWTLTSHDDSAWSAAEVVTIKTKMMPVLDHRKLFERPIPVLPETEERFKKAVQSTTPDSIDLQKWNELLSNDRAVTIPQDTTVSVDIQAEKLTTGFLELECEGGLDTDITILSSEGYEAKVDPTARFPRRQKGDRLATEGNDLYGPIHTYTCRPGAHTYCPFWFNTFRFVRLTITTARAAPLTLRRFAYRATHYPLEVRSRIRATPELEDMWRISVDTLRNCMHETYEDCPMYEQNQFAMDARLQMLFTYQLSRDDRLARKTMHEFFASRRDDGLVEAHFPVPFRAVNIPQFSLFWILMIHDHMMYFGDRALVRRYIGAADGILQHFGDRLDGRGLVGRLDDEAWPFVDWVAEWHDPAAGLAGMGVPPAYRRGGAATYNSLVYALALSHAADLCDYLGRRDTAAEYRGRARALAAAVNAHCWDARAAMYTDGPGTADRSQHSQVFAVLAGAVAGAEAADLMRRAVLLGPGGDDDDDDAAAGPGRARLPRCSYAMGFYVLRAAEKAGAYAELFPALMGPWRAMMRDNLGTWAEDDVGCRSDCHGWSASPIYELVAVVAGLRPRAPGYETIGFEPRRELVESFSGTFPVADGGDFSVSWRPMEGCKLVFPPDKDLTSRFTVQNVSRSERGTVMELGDIVEG